MGDGGRGWGWAEQSLCPITVARTSVTLMCLLWAGTGPNSTYRLTQLIQQPYEIGAVISTQLDGGRREIVAAQTSSVTLPAGACHLPLAGENLIRHTPFGSAPPSPHRGEPHPSHSLRECATFPSQGKAYRPAGRDKDVADGRFA